MQTRLQSRPDEPKISLPTSPQCTELWGAWEMWCVLPDSADAVRVRCGAKPSRDRECKKGTWLDQVRSIGLFDTAEGFWGIVGCTLPPSRLTAGVAYYMLRRNIAPMWEHEANRRGGRWVACFQQQDAVDAAWERLCVALIAEQMPCDETEICGAAVRRAERRREWKLSLWTRNAEDAEAQRRVGLHARELMGVAEGALQYLPHRELMQASEEGRRGAPAKYEV